MRISRQHGRHDSPGGELTFEEALRLAGARPQAAGEALEKRFRACRESGDISGACLAWCGVLTARALERKFAADSFSLSGLEFARENFHRLDPGSLAATVAVWIAALYSTVEPGNPECERWESTAFDLAARDNQPVVWLMLGITAAARRIWHGASFSAFVRIAKQIDGLPSPEPAGPHLTAAWRAARIQCDLLHAACSGEAASAQIAEGMRGAALAGIDSDGTPFGSTAFLRDLISGKLDDARTYFHRVAGFAPGFAPYDAWVFSFYKTWMLLAMRDFEAAMLESGRGLVYAQRAAVPHATAWAKFTYARVITVMQVATPTWHRLAEARREARRTRITALVFLCRLASALAALRLGHTTKAAALAAPALEYLEQSHLFHPPLFGSADFMRLVECVCAAGAPNPAPKLCEVHGIRANRGPDLPSRPAAEVEVFCLGAFSLKRGGRVLSWPRKAPRRPLDLLKATIAHGENGAPVAQLVDSLWPGMDGDRAHHAFTMALHRLRAILGEEAVVMREGQIKLNRESVWVDAFAFEEDAPTSEKQGLQHDKYRIALYRGVFLPDHPDAAWARQARDRLRDRHRNLVRRTSETFTASGAWRDALDLLNDALDRDPSAEVFYQGAISACLAGGLRAEASTYYERCKIQLCDQFGLSPSAKTESLYRMVLRTAPSAN